MAHPEHPPPLADQNNKRKRDAEDNGQSAHDRIPQPPPPQSGTFESRAWWERRRLLHSDVVQPSPADESTGNGAHINYLTKNPVNLQLIQGDDGAFSDVLRLVSDYEGVLSRHESLAANLGAQLTGPTLVKAMENLFQGQITVTQTDRQSSPVTWLDIVQFAKANPSEFTLTPSEHGHCCRFYLKGSQVEITEQDWRMIVSGTLDRCNLPPPLPVEEDENRELLTLDILEQRLHVLIKKADEVARKARQLNYHLSGRKAAINSRRTFTRSPPTHHATFTAHNHQQQTQASRPTSSYDLKADLLLQFTAASASHARPGSARFTQNSVSLPSTPVIPQGPSIPSNARHSLQPVHISGRASPAAGSEQRQTHQSAQSDDPSEVLRILITSRIDKLGKGEPVQPPCDRCRRLRVQCIKHLTACQGCTKKHAKCAWKTVTEEEIAWLKGEGSNGVGEGEGDDAASRSAGYTPDPQSATSATMVDTRTFAPASHYSSRAVTGNGYGGSGSDIRGNDADARSRDRQVTEFGLREQHPHSDHRLSHMASVALNPDSRDPHQHPQGVIPRMQAAKEA